MLSTNPRAGWATQAFGVTGSRTNQMAGGLSVAYTAAIWRQRPDAMVSA